MSMGNGEGSDRLVAGRYRLLSRLGRGGMGTVWRAEDELLNRQVAVKEVHLRGERSAEEREQQRERTLREARAVAQVRHPSVVGIHDVVEQDGDPWIVMELVDGASLGGRLAAEGPLPPREVAAIGLAVLSALEAAHARGVLHRDVKPDNVLLERETGRVVLTDFGIARLDGSTTLTERGAFLGSPEFTAPERTEGGAAGPESDLWSVGVLLCTALEGRSPFRRDTMSGVLYAVLYEDIVLPTSAEPLAPAIRGLLQRDPARRSTAVEASWLLTDCLERQPESASSTAETRRTAAGAGGRAGARAVPPPAPGRTLAEEAEAGVVPAATDSAPGTGVGAGVGPGRGRGRAVLLGAGVIVAAGALAAGGVLMFQQDGGSGTAVAQGSTAASAPASASRAPSAAPTPTSAPTSRSTPTSTPTSTAGTVPAGYTLRKDPGGFSLAVPDGWPRTSNDAGQIFYVSPDARYRIGIHPSQGASSKGVLTTLQDQDSSGPKVYPGFTRDTVQPTVFHNTEDAALMQWTWNGYPADRLGARRVQDLSWTENGETYDFWVSAPVDSLDQADRYFQVVSSTFRAD